MYIHLVLSLMLVLDQLVLLIKIRVIAFSIGVLYSCLVGGEVNSVVSNYGRIENFLLSG